MPRAPKSSRSATLPPDILAAWGKLLERCEALHALAPWRWIDGDSIIGVRDMESGEVDWCNIMGQGGDTFGVAMYPGNAGLHSLQTMLEHGPDEFDLAIQQRALVLTFNDRDLLTKDMVTVLKACGRRYRGADAWPELVEHDPGYFPMPPQDLARLLRATTAIECLIGTCVETAKKPGFARHDDQDRPWVATPEADGMTTMSREVMPKIPAPPLPVISINVGAVARASAKPRRAQTVILFDWFIGTTVIDGKDAAGRPYFATHAVALDTGTGMVLDLTLGRLETVWQDLAELLLKTCATTGVPNVVVVRRADAMHILAPLATALGTTLAHHPEVAEVIHELRNGLAEFGG